MFPAHPILLVASRLTQFNPPKFDNRPNADLSAYALNKAATWWETISSHWFSGGPAGGVGPHFLRTLAEQPGPDYFTFCYRPNYGIFWILGLCLPTAHSLRN